MFHRETCLYKSQVVVVIAVVAFPRKTENNEKKTEAEETHINVVKHTQRLKRAAEGGAWVKSSTSLIV